MTWYHAYIVKYIGGSKIVQISHAQILMIFWQIKFCWGKMDIYKYISGKHEPKSENTYQ